MQPQFTPPKTKEEFELRANKMTLEGAKSVLRSVETRKLQAVAPYDAEIEFLKKVIRHKGGTLGN